MRILTFCINQMLAFSYHTHLILYIITYWEQGLFQLPVSYLCQEISLIFHRVRTGAEPLVTILVCFGHSIVACCNQVVVVTTLLVKGSKLNQSVAHDIGIRC